jgi:NADH:ubiquinone oxidoreductase subunit F (NADH-binding)/ferredoxin
MSDQALTVMRIGQARVTSGLDRHPRLDLAAHRAVFGPLPRLSAAQLIAMCEAADLRGRGGAAFPVAVKLRAVQRNVGKRSPVVIVNGAEGEPGSGKDKMLLARSPHLVLDGARIAARALGGREVIVAVAGDGPHAQSVATAVAADNALAKLVKVVSVPDRFVSGESSALVNAINGGAALPSGEPTRASDAGIRGVPTLLSNAETFAQLAVLAMLGPAGYASTGTADEPGTVLLTVAGAVTRPAIVETPTGVPLGYILDICGAQPPSGILVGGYHGLWLTPEAAYGAVVSRRGLAAMGGTLGAGVVLVLGEESCPLAEVARVAGYLATQSSGQCGPCKLGLPAIARSLAQLVTGAGSVAELDALRHAAAGVRGRGACAHPDGTANFVASALDVFADDVSEHLLRGGCGRRPAGMLPLPPGAAEPRLSVDWTRCGGHGLCARLVPELVKLDRHGYPELLEAPVPFWLSRDARQAVDMCPALALRLTKGELSDATVPAMPAALAAGPKPKAIAAPKPKAIAAPKPKAIAAPGPTAVSGPARVIRSIRDAGSRDPESRPQADETPVLTGKALRAADLASTTQWLAVLGGHERPGQD